MMLKRALSQAVLVLFVAALAAASGASQGLKIGGAPAADDGKKDEAKPKKKWPEAKPEKAGEAQKPAKGKKKKAEEPSKYKSRALAESTESSYRFDADGNPVGAAAKKKAAAKAEKSSAAASEDKPAGKAACSDEEGACTEKPSDADAL